MIIGNDYYIITTAGFIKAGPLPIARDFPDIPKLPITAAYSTQDGRQKITHLISVRISFLGTQSSQVKNPKTFNIFSVAGPERLQLC